jgi:hypothetical protein
VTRLVTPSALLIALLMHSQGLMAIATDVHVDPVPVLLRLAATAVAIGVGLHALRSLLIHYASGAGRVTPQRRSSDTTGAAQSPSTTPEAASGGAPSSR